MISDQRQIDILVDLQLKAAEARGLGSRTRRIRHEIQQVRDAINGGDPVAVFNRIKAEHPEDAQAVADALARGVR